MADHLAEHHALFLARQARTRQIMRDQGVAALLTADPIDILYATGARNMTIFGLMSSARYLLLLAEGPSILFEYLGCAHLPAELPTVDEVRIATGLSYVGAGSALPAVAKGWADEITATLTPHLGARPELAVERLPLVATDALRAEGMVLSDAGAVFAEARRVKLAEELPLIREAMRRVEAAAQEMAEAIAPGRSEAEVWAAFHRGHIAREGEYISTRLLQGGARSFPYFRECGAAPLAKGDLVCFDSDALGYLGYAVDFSRTFLCGSERASPEQKSLYALAKAQLDHNVALFQPGRSYREIAATAWPIPEAYRPASYYCIAHGLGLSGEYPNVPHLRPDQPYPLDGVIEPGMVLCVESYIGAPEAGQGVKLEDQLLITASGPERLSTFPFCEALSECTI